ncbi:MAG: hypothetical protein QOI66_1552 [Myxococcales bacterium]|nr:hypothetical protein [Myxococcales bacterium]
MRAASCVAAFGSLLACAVVTANAHAQVPSPPPSPSSPDRDCLQGLSADHVAFVEAPPTKGVRTPIRLRGPLGSISLQLRGRDKGADTSGEGPLLDCALARALLDVGPVFDAAGIRTLVYSGTYQYRQRRGGSKLSEHAHGLAIDVHALVARDGTVYDVRRDFERGVGAWTIVAEVDVCVGGPTTAPGRLLRQLACRLRAGSVLREVITADDNSDHDDHFHLEAFPDAYTRARALLSPRIPVIDD